MKQTIGQFLAALRKEAGLTQAEVAERLGISDRTLSSWERDTRYPDILLLPELAALYRVTTDEILQGERRAPAVPTEVTPTEVSSPKETPAPRPEEPRESASRMDVFAVWACIAIGFVFAACACIALGADFFDGTLSGWGQPLYAVGWILLGVCAALLFAVYFAAKSKVRNGADRLSLSRGAFSFALVFALFPLIAGAVCLVTLAAGDRSYFVAAVTGGVLIALSAAVAAVASVRHALLLCRYGEGQVVRRTARFALRVGGFGAIPLVVAVAVLVTFWFVKPQQRDLVYSTADRAEFVAYAESIDVVSGNAYHFMNGIPEGEYFFDVSARYAAGEGERVFNPATNEEEFVMTFEGGFIARIRKGGVECTLSYTEENGAEGWVTATVRVTTDEGDFYPLRFERPAYSHHPAYGNPFFTGEGMAYGKDEAGNYFALNYANFDYAPLTNTLCGVTIVADFVTCAAIVLSRRRRAMREA